MVKIRASLVAWLVTLSCAWGVSLATPAPAQDCSTVVLRLADCLSFVTTGSTVVKPEGGCCAGLKTLLKTAPDCICQTVNNSGQLGFSLNMTRAAALPSVCGVESVPLSAACGLSSAPVASPAAAPKSTMSSAPSFSPVPDETTSSDTSSGIASPGPAKSGISTVSLLFIALTSMVVALCSHF